jgi:hypothetical protein
VRGVVEMRWVDANPVELAGEVALVGGVPRPLHGVSVGRVLGSGILSEGMVAPALRSILKKQRNVRTDRPTLPF